MPWLKTRYVQSLEEEILRLRTENSRLVERLLKSSGSPDVTLPPEPSKESIENMLQTHDIFADIDEGKDDGITDNRKEQYDEFVS